jgi:hypothetical protein
VGRLEEAAKMICVQLLSTIGDEKVYRLADKFVNLVSKERGYRGACENNPKVFVNDDDRVGARGKDLTKEDVSLQSCLG